MFEPFYPIVVYYVVLMISIFSGGIFFISFLFWLDTENKNVDKILRISLYVFMLSILYLLADLFCLTFFNKSIIS